MTRTLDQGIGRDLGRRQYYFKLNTLDSSLVVVVAVMEKLKFTYLDHEIIVSVHYGRGGCSESKLMPTVPLTKSRKMDKSKSKISSKLFYLAPLSNKNGHDTDKIDDEKFEFVSCDIIFMDF